MPKFTFLATIIGILIGLGISSISQDPPKAMFDPLKMSENLLAQDLFKKGYLARVECTLFNSWLEPLCSATLTPKSGGQEGNPIRYRGSHSHITWESY